MTEEEKEQLTGHGPVRNLDPDRSVGQQTAAGKRPDGFPLPDGATALRRKTLSSGRTRGTGPGRNRADAHRQAGRLVVRLAQLHAAVQVELGGSSGEAEHLEAEPDPGASAVGPGPVLSQREEGHGGVGHAAEEEEEEG